MELNNNLTIEQFAAFLDGNLPEKEMELVSSAIESTKAYSDVLSEVMLVDDTVDEYMNQPDATSEVLMDMDFDLPIVPEMADSSDLIELTTIVNQESETVEFLNNDVNIQIVADQEANIAGCSSLSETIQESPSSNELFNIEEQADDSNDFLDLA